MKITISNRLILTEIPGPLRVEICGKLTMRNPAYIENERMNRSNFKTERLLRFYQMTPDGGLIIPRGAGRMIVNLSSQFSEPVSFDDHRISFPEVHFSFKGELRDYQEVAVNAMLKKDWGVLQSPTGSGKTIMALAVIATRKQPAIIVCHSAELMRQWITRISDFLDIPECEVGIIGAGKKRIGEKVTVSLVQSLVKCADQVSGHVGFLVVDECHRTPSKTFSDVVSQFDCKYMLGLSATPYRRDKLTRLIHLYLGDSLHTVDAGALVEAGQVLRPKVIQRATSFRTGRNPSSEYSTMLRELTEDPDRNRLIARDVAGASKHWDGINLVLTDRKGHCAALQEILQLEHGVDDVAVLTGDVSAKERASIVDQLNAGRVKTLIATGQLIGEGFDCRELSTLFLATPIKFSGRVLQYLGRVLRPAPGKQAARVLDYVDIHVPVLAAGAKARQRVYSRRS
jgi:superfamily II DNA or RNA helicase